MHFEDSGVPLYLQLHAHLKQRIVSGKWPQNSLIPSESTLMQIYGVGRETARRAVLRLVNEGYLYRQRGKGTFVCRRRPEDVLENLLSFTSEMISRGYRPGTTVLGHDERIPAPKTQEVLATNEGEKVLYIKRLRTANDLPIAVEESFLIKEILGSLEEHKLTGSFYESLFYDKGIKPSKVVQEISSTLADEDTAALLEIDSGHPLLRITRLMYTTDNRPFFYLIFHLRGDMYSIKTKLNLL